MKHVPALNKNDVKEASRKAFAAIPDLKLAITNLIVLKGICHATASAVLAVYAPDVAPFMSDEAMISALGNARGYTLKRYLVLVKMFHNKTKELTEYHIEHASTAKDLDWSAWNFEKAIWASFVQFKSSNDVAKIKSNAGI
ncbi:hypothetical protein R1sor_010634 [Riccia sorocarpa]|uniref:Uncharacterized protein n=1 Tax=Riccia sorocarpa TaxID=122646 RepID=A0ABD3HYM2_9MARC